MKSVFPVFRQVLALLVALSALSCDRAAETWRVSDRAPFPLEEAHPERSMLARWAQKEVLDARLLDDMEEARWTVREGKPELSYTRERSVDGVQSLRQRVSLVDWDHILDPAERTPWDSFQGEQGGWTCVALEFEEPQDWRAYNRISLWVYIHPSRNPNVSFALDVVNATPDGTLTPTSEPLRVIHLFTMTGGIAQTH